MAGIPTTFHPRTQTIEGNEATNLASFGDVAWVLFGLAVFVLLVLGLATLAFRGLGPEARERAEIRGLGLPRGSVRAIIALLIIGSFVGLALLGDRLLTSQTFDKVLASFGTLTGAVSGFYFGARTGQDLEEGEAEKLAAAMTAASGPTGESSEVAAPMVIEIGPGAMGPIVDELQARLFKARVTGLTQTGVFDDATVSAVKQIQRRNDVAATGIVDGRTWALLPPAW
ncbi:MAG: peptidoglycan-binding domain-containing protein [Actinomycetota bacterium]